MASFVGRRRFVTRDPILRVDGDLGPGTYTFELQVIDRSGNLSKAAQVKVEIVRRSVVGPITHVTTRPDSGGTVTGGTIPIIRRRPGDSG